MRGVFRSRSPAGTDKPARFLPSGRVLKGFSLFLIAASTAVCGHGLFLSFVLGRTEAESYRHKTGLVLLLIGLVALGLSCFGLDRASGIGKSRAEQLILAAAWAAAAALLLLAGGETWAYARMNPFGPELEALAAFNPPAGAKPGRLTKSASNHPTIGFTWLIPEDNAAHEAQKALEAWADPNTLHVDYPTPTSPPYLTARRGREKATVQISSHIGYYLLSLHITRM